MPKPHEVVTAAMGMATAAEVSPPVPFPLSEAVVERVHAGMRRHAAFVSGWGSLPGQVDG
jgi:hypothetical protein